MWLISYLGLSRDELEILFFGSQVFVPIIALVGAIVAVIQIGEISRSRRATFMLELDGRFDSDKLTEARQVIRELLHVAVAEESANHPHASDGMKAQYIPKHCAKAIDEWRKNDTEKYTILMGYMGFFETVGLMVKRKYVKLEDIHELFLGPILDIERVFGEHIKDRQNEMGVPAGFYEHALFLVAQSKKRLS